MSEKENSHRSDNKFVQAMQTVKEFRIISYLIIILLSILILYLLYRMAPIFRPVWTGAAIVFPPLIISILFYYLSKPVVNFFRKKGLSRQVSIILFYITAVIVIIFGIAILVPTVQEQVSQMAVSFPIYWDQFLDFIERNFGLENITQLLDQQIEAANLGQLLQEQWQSILNVTVGGISNVVSTVVSTVIVLFTSPILLYFLLKDDHKIASNIIDIFPGRWKVRVSDLLHEANYMVSSYVRGQLLVAVIVGIMFFIGFSIIGLDYALTLAMLAGVLNLVPYLGSFLATIPALIIALMDSPFMLLKTIIVFLVEQFLEGRVAQPLVLGNNLGIHPMTILFVLLIGGRLGGIFGVFLAIPIYAVAKVIVSHFFRWYKEDRISYDSDIVKRDR